MRHGARLLPAWVLLLALATAAPAAARAPRQPPGSAGPPGSRAAPPAPPALPGSTAASAAPAVPPGSRAAGVSPGGTAVPARSAAARRGAFVPGRVLVGFRPGAGRAARRAAAAAVGGRALASGRRTEVLALARDADVPAAARRLAATSGVAFAEPDWIRHLEACGACWQLGPSPGVNATAAHGGGHTGAGATVAVIDTGVADVADLSGRVASRRFCSPTVAADPLTHAHCRTATAAVSFSHGTEVASLIAAADDGAGITGVAPDALVKSWRVDGGGGGIPVSAEVDALDEVALDGTVDAVNLSLGGPEWSQAEQDAVGGVLAAGIPVVAAAGNDGNYVPSYPAAYDGVVSVGATGEDGAVASFSAYGKVDVVAPGACVPVARRPGSSDQLQRSDCPLDPSPTAHYDSGTSFAAPLVAGTLVLAATGSAVRDRLAVEATARAGPPAGQSDGKPWAHGLVDADAFVAAHDPGSPTLLVLDATGPFGSGDGQLPHPATTFAAAAFNADGSLVGNPGSAVFGGAAADSTVAFSDPDGDGVSTATAGSDDLAPGTQAATVTIQGSGTAASATVRALGDDDQAPGIALSGPGDDAWRRAPSASLQSGGDGDTASDNVGDVYGVVLQAGDTLDATVTRTAGDPTAAVLFEPGTGDVFGQLDRVVACAGGPAFGCPTTGLHFTARSAGTYLLDVYAAPDELGRPASGRYRLTWTVHAGSDPSVTVSVAACSPNGDGVQERCAWTAHALGGATVTSFVTRGASGVLHLAGAGARSWGGHDDGLVTQPDGAYWLRVRYLDQPSGHALLRAFPLTLDRRPPRIADPAARPNPFEPLPHDGDRDTVTFAITSSEAGALEVVVYRYASTTVVRRLRSGRQPAGRQRLTWNGRSTSGTWLHGRYSYTIQTVDAAGNRARSHRHQVAIA